MKQLRKFFKDASFFPLSHKEEILLNELSLVAKQLDLRLAIPATSGNFSIRCQNNAFLISRSGIHKRDLNPKKFVRSDLFGNPLGQIKSKPSDETYLHASVYRNFQDIQCVLHCHPPEIESIDLKKCEYSPFQAENMNVIQHGYFKIEGHELIKALGEKTHETQFYLPVIQNSQDIFTLAGEVEALFFTKKPPSPLCAFVLERHGIYCFGNSIKNAHQKLEAILYLISLKS